MFNPIRFSPPPQRPSTDQASPLALSLKRSEPEGAAAHPGDVNLPPRKRRSFLEQRPASRSPTPAASAPNLQTFLQAPPIRAPLDAARLQALMRLAADMGTVGHWNSQAGDLAPKLLVQLTRWPDRPLEVHDARRPGAPYVFNEAAAGEPVRVALEGEHYQALVGDGPVLNKRQVPGEGECFYLAVVVGLGPKDALTLAGRPCGPADEAAWDLLAPDVAAVIRQEVACSVLTNPELPELVDFEKLARPPSARRSEPAARLPDVVPRIAVPLLLIQELSGLIRPGDMDHNKALLEKFAEEKNVSLGMLRRWFNLSGKRLLDAEAILQIASRSGQRFRAIPPDFLQRLSLDAQRGKVRLTDDAIIRIAGENGFSIRSLRHRIRVSGELTRIGQSLADRSMDEIATRR